MTAKERFEQALYITGRIDDNTDKLMELKAVATKVTASMSGEAVGGSHNPDKMTDIVSKIMQRKKKAVQYGGAQFDTAHTAIALIALLENPIHRQVLHKRYILALSFRRIAKEMGYTYRNILYIHDRAIAKLDKMVEDRGTLDFSL